MIVFIFIGLGRAYRLRGDFEFIKWGGQATKGWDHFYGEGDPSRHHVMLLIWEL